MQENLLCSTLILGSVLEKFIGAHSYTSVSAKHDVIIATVVFD